MQRQPIVLILKIETMLQLVHPLFNSNNKSIRIIWPNSSHSWSIDFPQRLQRPHIPSSTRRLPSHLKFVAHICYLAARIEWHSPQTIAPEAPYGRFSTNLAWTECRHIVGLLFTQLDVNSPMFVLFTFCLCKVCLFSL